jgi:anion-transporting  ArsA/GET3 family ATPase
MVMASTRIVFVTGKGGVGKSTVAAALARSGARRGERPLLVRLSPIVRAPPVAGVTTIDVEGAAALGEYLETEALPPRLARRVTRNRLYRQFTAAAPGLPDLMAVGKILHEARRYSGNHPTWDRVVVDTPATGHVVEVLRMPAAAAGVFGGLVRREAERLVLELRDPALTTVVPVALAEELVVNETIELIAALSALGLTIGRAVVNRLHAAPLAPDAVPVAPAGASRLVADVLAAARIEAALAASNARQLARLLAALDAPPVRLPQLFAERVGTAELDLLAEELERQTAGATEAA